jgi:HK97 family phage prohead protease
MAKRVTKLFNTKPSSIDEDERSVEFVISTDQVDRYGEIVDQKTWDFKSFLKNPVVFWGHTSHEPEYVLGTASDLKVSEDGKQTTARLNFDTDINPKADLVFNQIKRGTLRTVSVGFMSGKMEMDAKDDDAPWILKDNELLEISVVPIPANPGAVALGMKSGDIKRKDAKWLMDSMRAEADLMQRQYEASNLNRTRNL